MNSKSSSGVWPPLRMPCEAPRPATTASPLCALTLMDILGVAQLYRDGMFGKHAPARASKGHLAPGAREGEHVPD